MADKIKIHLEEMLPEMIQLIKRGIFTKEEVKMILKQREDFEYCFSSKRVQQTDYLKSIEYEYELQKQRRERMQELKLKRQTTKDFSIVRRTIQLWDKTTHRFKYDISLWKQYISYCYSLNSKKYFYQAVSAAIRMNPKSVDLWLMPIYYEFQVHNNPFKARKIFYKALKLSKQSNELWAQYFRFELLCYQKIQVRKQLLLNKGEEGIQEQQSNNQFRDNIDFIEFGSDVPNKKQTKNQDMLLEKAYSQISSEKDSIIIQTVVNLAFENASNIQQVSIRMIEIIKQRQNEHFYEFFSQMIKDKFLQNLQKFHVEKPHSENEAMFVKFFAKLYQPEDQQSLIKLEELVIRILQEIDQNSQFLEKGKAYSNILTLLNDIQSDKQISQKFQKGNFAKLLAELSQLIKKMNADNILTVYKFVQKYHINDANLQINVLENLITEKLNLSFDSKIFLNFLVSKLSGGEEGEGEQFLNDFEKYLKHFNQLLDFQTKREVFEDIIQQSMLLLQQQQIDLSFLQHLIQIIYSLFALHSENIDLLVQLLINQIKITAGVESQILDGVQQIIKQQYNTSKSQSQLTHQTKTKQMVIQQTLSNFDEMLPQEKASVEKELFALTEMNKNDIELWSIYFQFKQKQGDLVGLKNIFEKACQYNSGMLRELQELFQNIESQN